PLGNVIIVRVIEVDAAAARATRAAGACAGGARRAAAGRAAAGRAAAGRAAAGRAAAGRAAGAAAAPARVEPEEDPDLVGRAQVDVEDVRARGAAAARGRIAGVDRGAVAHAGYRIRLDEGLAGRVAVLRARGAAHGGGRVHRGVDAVHVRPLVH